ncbi:GPP34 family phosphoprotein, partial [Kibdelosporangium lantanae]
SAMLGRSRCDLPTATLALVAWAAGLDDIAEPDLTRRQMADWVERLKNMTIEPIARLVAGTEAAIAATVYGGNRA